MLYLGHHCFSFLQCVNFLKEKLSPAVKDNGYVYIVVKNCIGKNNNLYLSYTRVCYDKNQHDWQKYIIIKVHGTVIYD